METTFVIRNDNTGKFIAIDMTSGGYPYDTDLKHAAHFETCDIARAYRDTMKEIYWSLHELVLTTKEKTWEDIQEKT